MLRSTVPAAPIFESSQPRYQIGKSRSLPMILDLTPHPVVPNPSTEAPGTVEQSSYCLQLAMTKLKIFVCSTPLKVFFFFFSLRYNGHISCMFMVPNMLIWCTYVLQMITTRAVSYCIYHTMWLLFLFLWWERLISTPLVTFKYVIQYY